MTTSESQPINPFESAFSLIRELRNEIQKLKADAQEFRDSTTARFEKVEANIGGFRAWESLRFGELSKEVEKIKAAKNSRFDQMEAILEELRNAKSARLDKLEDAIKKETCARLHNVQSLDTKICARTKELQVHCERNSAECSRQKTEADSTRELHLQNIGEVRQDLEKLAALISSNSLSRDPFTDLGYHASNPDATSTALGKTTYSCLPPVFGNHGMLGRTS